MLQDAIDTAALSFLGGLSFYYICYTFEFNEDKYDLMVKFGILLGLNVGLMRAIYNY